MSGHSKWANIKRTKEKVDAKRGKIFTKLGREILVAVKEGGSGDVQFNSKLKDVVAKAKAANMPNDTIQRSIAKASGDGSSSSYETIIYEGYGPNGVAVIVETLTDNKNRTAGDVRHYFDKFGGNLGTTGCVGWMFDKKGVIIIEKEFADDKKIDEEQLMLMAIDAGAEDFSKDGDVYEIVVGPDDFSSVRETLEQNGLEFLEAEIKMVPQNYTGLNEDDATKMQRLIDALEDNDDVQDVWHNWDEI